MRRLRSTILPTIKCTRAHLPLVRKVENALSARALSAAAESTPPPALVETTDAGRFATLTLNRPHAHNALNDGITGATQTTLTKLRECTGLRAVFIKAVGPTFCGGGDLKDFVKSATDPPHENHVRAKEFVAFLKGLNAFPKPVVALVSGSLMIFVARALSTT